MCSLIRALIPFVRVSPHDVITSQNTPSHWGLGFQHKIFGDIHLVYNIADWVFVCPQSERISLTSAHQAYHVAMRMEWGEKCTVTQQIIYTQRPWKGEPLPRHPDAQDWFRAPENEHKNGWRVGQSAHCVFLFILHKYHTQHFWHQMCEGFPHTRWLSDARGVCSNSVLPLTGVGADHTSEGHSLTSLLLL